jgi:esterase/lipase superfamily enzyme
MLFITNRFPSQSIRTRVGRNFSFDLDNNAPGNSVFFCERATGGAITEIGSQGFLQQLRRCDTRQILLYIHGFGNLPEDVFAQALQLQRLCDRARQDEVKVVPLIWPCDNDLGIVKDYWDDQKSADLSAFAFARALEKFIAWRNDTDANPTDDPCLKRVNVLAHSMGNRVLRAALAAWNRYDLHRGAPLIFRNTFMMAADVVNDTLHYGEPGELICHASRNVVVYHAADDLALRSSKAANLRNKVASRRLGHTGPEDMQLTPRNVYSVDCDDINNHYDKPFGHSYFGSSAQRGRPGKVFQHLFACLLHGRVFPDDEHRRTTVIRG